MNEPFNPDNPAHLLMWCMQNNVRVTIIPFMALVKRARVKHINAPGGHRVEVGEALLNVPAMIAKQIKGPADERDVYVLIQIPRAAYERAKSPIILPGVPGFGAPSGPTPGGSTH